MDGVIKQSQGISVPGKLLVTWGDQLIFPGQANLGEQLAGLSNSNHALLFGFDFPEDQFTESDAKAFGWQVVSGGSELLGFDDTRDYQLITTKLAELKAQGYQAVVRWNMGTFALSPELIEAIFEAFAEELTIV